MKDARYTTPFLMLSACIVFAVAYVAILVREPREYAPHETAVAAAATLVSSSRTVAQARPATTSVPQAHVTVVSTLPPNTPAVAVTGSSSTIITKPTLSYPAPAVSPDIVNARARGAVVNILCTVRAGGSMSAISGSGVLIDPRGVILTNAHVAQYVLLSESPQVDLDCVVRTDSPAVASWKAEVLYMPKVWVDQHASEINTPHPVGTGEHDYALLRVVSSTNNIALPSQFPYIPYDTRNGAVFLGDTVVGIGYPAEFVGSGSTQGMLYAVSSVSKVEQLLTFASSSLDAVSIGSVVEAQGGSSGGAVVNVWQYLVGLITSTSAGQTTAQRDLRALTLDYINRDLMSQTGQDIKTFLTGDLAAKERTFNETTARGLIQEYIDTLGGSK